MRAPFTQLYVHLVWSTRDRDPWITAQVQPRLYAAILQKCKEMKCNPLALGGTDTHVHLLIHLHPTTAIAHLVKEVKGSSSHLVNHEILPGKEKYWQGAYGAFTIRKDEVEQITDYISNQEKHHQENTVIKEFEQDEVLA